MTEPAITPELVTKHNLTPDESACDERGALVFARCFATVPTMTFAPTA